MCELVPEALMLVYVHVRVGGQGDLLGIAVGLHPGVHASHQYSVVQVRTPAQAATHSVPAVATALPWQPGLRRAARTLNNP